MMNRIILIGNGFDLAHGLPTSYKEFIENYWMQWPHILKSCNSSTYSDRLAIFSCRNKEWLWCNLISQWHEDHDPFKPLPAKKIIEAVTADAKNFTITRIPFFEAINKAVATKNWVDIENEYYQLLKRIVKKETKLYESPQGLDEELEIVKSKLIAYLSEIQKNQITPKLINEDIRKAIYAPFKAKDISIEGRTAFDEFLVERWKKAQNTESPECKNLFYRFCYNWQFDPYDIQTHVESCDISKHIDRIYNGAAEIHDYFILPSEFLLLNFNYTKTADLYIPKNYYIKTNHIHGELNNVDNPIIFGHGDEMDEDYKMISNLNDNSYLNNIKSIRYLETDNYRQLLSFIDSAPFQIYIMGHSCGNSDRTLLNTLFEHKNCVSIKPFYYEKQDGSDNYIEIIQNISRNFNDMRLMRDRVVNKTYCRPLVPQEK